MQQARSSLSAAWAKFKREAKSKTSKSQLRGMEPYEMVLLLRQWLTDYQRVHGEFAGTHPSSEKMSASSIGKKITAGLHSTLALDGML